MRFSRSFLATALLVGTMACSKADDSTTNDAFTLAMSPPRVNRLIPGERPLVVVATAGAAGSDIAFTVTSSLVGATVTVEPKTAQPPGVVEVWITIPEVTEEVPFTVTLTGQRGATIQSTTVEGSAVPGVDDLQPIALDIASVFLEKLAGQVEGLPADRAGLVRGTPVAGLLVVTHYAWFTDTYEISLGWHIMVAPDDWAELSMRPRGALVPTKAYKLSSWSTALKGGAVTITEIPPPETVTR